MASNPQCRLSLYPTPKTLIKPNHLSPFTARPLYSLHSLKSTAKIPSCAKFSPLPKMITPCMPYKPVTAKDRLISTLVYTLPLINTLNYHRNIPALNPILPMANYFSAIPFISSFAFYFLFYGVSDNPNYSTYVRYNSAQALLQNFVLLIVAPMILRWFSIPALQSGFGPQFNAMGHNVIFVFSILCFVYEMLSCVYGRTPNLPFFVGDAASAVVGMDDPIEELNQLPIDDLEQRFALLESSSTNDEELSENSQKKEGETQPKANNKITKAKETNATKWQKSPLGWLLGGKIPNGLLFLVAFVAHDIIAILYQNQAAIQLSVDVLKRVLL